MQLTATAVDDIFRNCLFKDGEPTEPRVISEGVVTKAGFHPGRLEEHRAAITELLAELPAQFHEATGGGWSFLNACVDKNDNQWGEHRDIDALLILGQAIGKVKVMLPRDMWAVLPGGVPYFMVKK